MDLVATPERHWRVLRARGATPDVILDACGITSPAVPVRDIAKAMGVFVHDVPNPGWSGAVVAKDHSAVIWLDLKEVEQRRRFTIAHEIGHLMKHDLGVAYRDVTFVENQKELEANAFAAALLMPFWMLWPLVGVPFGGPTVAQLAELFFVSERAMNLRIMDLMGEPVVDAQWQESL